MAVKRYLLGQAVKLETDAYFEDTVIDLDLTAFVLEITRDETIVATKTNADLTLDETDKTYWLSYTPPVVGDYTWYWQQTGEVPSADQGEFVVYAVGAS